LTTISKQLETFIPLGTLDQIKLRQAHPNGTNQIDCAYASFRPTPDWREGGGSGLRLKCCASGRNGLGEEVGVGDDELVWTYIRHVNPLFVLAETLKVSIFI
jgi:hypothetical protein